MTYGGALSFCAAAMTVKQAATMSLSAAYHTIVRQPIARAVAWATRYSGGIVQLAELKAFPFGFDLAEHLSVADFGDCFINPHRPETVATMIEAHAEKIIQKTLKC